MNWDEQTYSDRFGNDWDIQPESKSGKSKRVLFRCDEILLVATEDETEEPPASTAERVKELFCDAERVVVHEDEKWYVGYRTRTGRGGRATDGVQTRFRSESGEVRYAKKLLQFRHMPEAQLCKQLAVAAKSTVKAQA